MKAFLLAAGLGSRLRPITNTTPKCMVSIGGRPLLYWWMRLLSKHNVDEVLVNTHYLPAMVREFIFDHNKLGHKPYIHEFYESKLLGSGGTVRENQDFVRQEESFLICYADNLTSANLTKLVSLQNQCRGVMTMALFHANKPEQCGIATLDYQKKIVSFIEKPEFPQSDLAYAGIYVASPQLFSFIPTGDVVDFGKDVLPKLVGHMYGCEISDYLLDIGTLDNYAKAQKEWTY